MSSDGSGRILASERFDKYAQVDCTGNGINVQFKNGQSYKLANQSWNWINEKNGRYVVFVTESGKCGNAKQIWNVTQINGNQDMTEIDMNAQKIPFKKAFRHTSLRINTEGVDQKSKRWLQKRDDTAIPISHDFSQVTILDASVGNSVDLGLACGDCRTAGSLPVDADVDTDFNPFDDDPTLSGTVTHSPKRVSATIGGALDVTGEIAKEFDKSQQILQVSLLGSISITEVETLGPSLSVDFDAVISSISAEVSLNAGTVTMHIPDYSKATLVFTDLGNDNSKGWIRSSPPRAHTSMPVLTRKQPLAPRLFLVSTPRLSTKVSPLVSLLLLQSSMSMLASIQTVAEVPNSAPSSALRLMALLVSVRSRK